MPAQRKLVAFFIALTAIFLFFPEIIFAQVVINEVLPNPPGDDATGEWVELYNLGTVAVDVAGYRLEDASGHPLVIDENYVETTTVIETHQWLVVKRNSSSFSLNNSGTETISFYSSATASAQPLDSFSYTGSSEEKSWGRIPDGSGSISGEKLEPTPGSANFVPSPSPGPSPSPTSTSTSDPTPETSPTSEITSSSSPTANPKPIKVIGATFGEVLGEEASPASFYPWEATKEGESQEATETSQTKLIPWFILGLGAIFLVTAGTWLCYTYLKKGKVAKSEPEI